MRTPGTSKITGNRAYTLSHRYAESIRAAYMIAQREKWNKQQVMDYITRNVYDKPEFARLTANAKEKLWAIDRNLFMFVLSNVCCYHAYQLGDLVVPSKDLVGGPHWEAFRQYEKEYGYVKSGFCWNDTEVWFSQPTAR